MNRLLALLTFLLLLPAGSLRSDETGKRLTLEMLTREGGMGRGAGGLARAVWRPGGHQLSYLRQQGRGGPGGSALTGYDAQTAKETVLFDPGAVKERLAAFNFQWSPSGDALLLRGERDLWLVTVATGQARRLTNDAEDEDEATFAPTGDRIGFVKKNDLYAVDVGTGAAQRLTSDGSDTVYNGKLDWVYQEEMSHRSARAYEWSPDGKQIIYLRLDDARVPEYTLTDFLSVHPALIRQRYPKAGDPNPVPSVHVVTVGEPQPANRSLPLSGSAEYVVPRFSWTPESGEASVMTLNRAQNELTVTMWDPVAGRSRPLLVERESCWVNCLEAPYFLKDGRRCLWLSERDGWLHLYLYDRGGQALRQLTRGEWMIDPHGGASGQGFDLDEKGGWVYFVATEKDPRERHLYRVRLDGSGFVRLTQEEGTHSLRLSPDGSLLLETFSSLDHPAETRLLRPDGSVVATLEQPKSPLADYALGKTEFFEVKTADGAALYARLTRPANFDPKAKYPVLIRIYGGPEAQTVRKSWGVASLADHYLAQEGYLIWALDNRGSWGRGHAWETAVYKKLGQRELEDQLAGIAFLKSLHYVDPNRIGIQGWSYGGYMTLYALTHAPEVFKCGVAGAPVSDWKFYDTIYTERYMGTPATNPDGYKGSSPLEAAANLRGRLLLIHGTADNNVHMQNTISFLDALVRARRPYELHIQPGQGHGFGGQAPRSYLIEREVEFIRRCL